MKNDEEVDIPTQAEIFLTASSVKNPVYRALFVFEYLSGGRVSEIVRRMKKKQLENIKIDGKDFISFNNLYTEKNIQINRRSLPIPIFKEERLYKLASEHLNSLLDDDIIFDFSRITAWKHIRRIVKTIKEFSKNPFLNSNHFLRHCRLTHLVTIYDYNEQELIRFAGWTDGRPAKSYIQLKITDLARKMM